MANKQVESCFLNHNSSIHFCCTDFLLMTHRGGLCLNIIISNSPNNDIQAKSATVCHKQEISTTKMN
jgi:hypothetical protein